MTLIPWRLGRPIVQHVQWDATCVDTLGPSHLPGTAVKVSSAAASTEAVKRRKYVSLSGDYTCTYLDQKISISVQRGDAASILGTLPGGSDLTQVLYL